MRIQGTVSSFQSGTHRVDLTITGSSQPGALKIAAVEIMRWINEGTECVICGVVNGPHIKNALCDRFDEALNP